MAWSAASAATAATQTVATRRAATAAVTPGGQVSAAAMQQKNKTKVVNLNCVCLFSSQSERKNSLNLSDKMFRHFHRLFL